MSYQLGPVDPQERPEGYAAVPGHEARPARRRALSSALAVLVMAVFAGGLWLAYEEGSRHAGGEPGDVPLIRADPSPMKRKPAEPGGMKIPDRNMLIFGERHPAVEHLLPPPETPLPRPAPPPVPQPPAAQPAAMPAAPPAVTPAETGPSQPPAAAAQAGLSAASPPAAARPDATPSTTAPARPQHASAGPRETRQPEAKPAPAPPETKPAATKPEPAKPEPGRRHAAAALPKEAHGTRLQLGALRSPAAAREEWQRLKRANPALLGKLSAYAVRADLGAKGVFYRIETEPFADAAAADRLCDALKRRNFRCFIAR